jgi:hypothetical protein
MNIVSVTQFKEHIRHYESVAQGAPVPLSYGGSTVGYFLSPQAVEQLNRLLAERGEAYGDLSLGATSDAA